MTEPVTTLDTRFSDPDAVPTDWHETRNVLETAQLFWISTVRGDGRPHVTPLVAVWLDDVIYFTTGPDEQKAVNLRSNAHVILMTGCNQWEPLVGDCLRPQRLGCGLPARFRHSLITRDRREATSSLTAASTPCAPAPIPACRSDGAELPTMRPAARGRCRPHGRFRECPCG
jgi:hypothetical protein